MWNCDEKGKEKRKKGVKREGRWSYANTCYNKTLFTIILGRFRCPYSISVQRRVVVHLGRWFKSTFLWKKDVMVLPVPSGSLARDGFRTPRAFQHFLTDGHPSVRKHIGMIRAIHHRPGLHLLLSICTSTDVRADSSHRFRISAYFHWGGTQPRFSEHRPVDHGTSASSPITTTARSTIHHCGSA